MQRGLQISCENLGVYDSVAIIGCPVPVTAGLCASDFGCQNGNVHVILGLFISTVTVDFSTIIAVISDTLEPVTETSGQKRFHVMAMRKVFIRGRVKYFVLSRVYVRVFSAEVAPLGCADVRTMLRTIELQCSLGSKYCFMLCREQRAWTNGGESLQNYILRVFKFQTKMKAA